MQSHHTTVTFWGIEELNSVRVYDTAKQVGRFRADFRRVWDLAENKFGWQNKNKQSGLFAALSAKNLIPQKIFDRNGAEILQLALIILIDNQLAADLKTSVVTALPLKDLRAAYEIAQTVNRTIAAPEWRSPSGALIEMEACEKTNRNAVPGYMDFRA